jgi:hypothetical protein
LKFPSLFKRRAKGKKAATASSAIAGSPTDILTCAPPAAALVVGQHTEQRRDGHLGMQGYAPVIAQTRNRRYCEYCGEGVYKGVRHICWGNVENNLSTLTPEERIRIMGQLARKPKKLTRAQLSKLYAADGKGALSHVGDRA